MTPVALKTMKPAKRQPHSAAEHTSTRPTSASGTHAPTDSRPSASAPEPQAGGTDFWSRPQWGFPQAIAASMAVVLPMAAAQTVFPDLRTGLPPSPFNWFVVFAPLLIFALARQTLRDNPIIRGLGCVPMAIVSLLLLAIITLPGAVWPQDGRAPGWIHALGMDHVFSSLPFAAAMSLVLMNIAIAVGKRVHPWHRGSTRFMLVHVGLLVAIGAALAGTGSLERLRLPLMTGAGPSNIALNASNEQVLLPFAARLEQFTLDTFPPTLSVLTRAPGGQNNWQVAPGSQFVQEGFREEIAGLTIEVIEWIPSAGIVGGVPRAFQEPGAGPAARIRVTKSGDPATAVAAGAPTAEVLGEGWVHAQSSWGEELWVQTADGRAVMMNPPRPRVFESKVELMSPEDAEVQTVAVRVNEPVHYAGWTLYQLDYDAEGGAMARYSVLEAVRDPAYPVVAVGCWLIIAGMVLYWWQAASVISRRSRMQFHETEPQHRSAGDVALHVRGPAVTPLPVATHSHGGQA